MAEWLRRAFAEWLGAECAAGSLLVVLEDVHWGDVASVNYLRDGLRTLAAKPFMVLALGRPETHDKFPNLWANCEKQEIVLGRLTPRAAEKLVREALGGTLPSEEVARIVERCDGNAPFFILEELIRCVAERGG